MNYLIGMLKQEVKDIAVALGVCLLIGLVAYAAVYTASGWYFLHAIHKG